MGVTIWTNQLEAAYNKWELLKDHFDVVKEGSIQLKEDVRN